MNDEDLFQGYGVQVTLANQEDFLKIRETLTRIGVESRRNKTLFQSCHILHKRGSYAIIHFKELFCLDGKESSIDENDIQRRNTITQLLDEWGLVKIVGSDDFYDNAEFAPMNQVKVISHREKDEWDLQPKYNIGNSKRK